MIKTNVKYWVTHAFDPWRTAVYTPGYPVPSHIISHHVMMEGDEALWHLFSIAKERQEEAFTTNFTDFHLAKKKRRRFCRLKGFCFCGTWKKKVRRRFIVDVTSFLFFWMILKRKDRGMMVIWKETKTGQGGVVKDGRIEKRVRS